MVGKAAVIAWVLAVGVVLFVHGSTPHGVRSGPALIPAQAVEPAPGPCTTGAVHTHETRSDPADGDHPAPWGRCDTAPHRSVPPPSGHGGHSSRGCSGAHLAEPTRALLALPYRAAHGGRRDTGPARSRLQVFRC